MIIRRDYRCLLQLLVLLVFVVSVSLCAEINLRGNISVESSNYVKEENKNDDLKERPKMHTYFTEVSKNPTPDKLLLEAWKASWYDAGWEPIVLGPEDAQQHPHYNKFIAAFDAAPKEVRDYDRACYLRWLAMGMQSGGGWMSDFDTFPLYMTPSMVLPNDGKFTSYSRHVPNLVSGNASEWNRMSQLIYFSYSMHQNIFWSDMLALKEIHELVGGYVYQSDSIALERLYVKELPGTIERPYALGSKCEQLLGMRAIHFSHADCDRVGFCHRDRQLAKKWIEQWKEKCNSFITK